MLSAASGCELSTTTRVKTVQKMLKEVLPVLSSCYLSFKTCGHMYSSCVRSTMLHARATWPLTKPNLQCLQQNDRAVIRQTCNVKSRDIVTIRSNELLARLGIDLILKKRRLCWYGHVECSNGAVKPACDKQVDGKHGPGRPKITWKQLTAIYLEGGPLMWILPLYLQVNKISVEDDHHHDDDDHDDDDDNDGMWHAYTAAATNVINMVTCT